MPLWKLTFSDTIHAVHCVAMPLAQAVKVNARPACPVRMKSRSQADPFTHPLFVKALVTVISIVSPQSNVNVSIIL